MSTGEVGWVSKIAGRDPRRCQIALINVPIDVCSNMWICLVLICMAACLMHERVQTLKEAAGFPFGAQLAQVVKIHVLLSAQTSSNAEHQYAPTSDTVLIINCRFDVAHAPHKVGDAVTLLSARILVQLI
jgi:hypothetical protein